MLTKIKKGIRLLHFTRNDRAERTGSIIIQLSILVSCQKYFDQKFLCIFSLLLLLNITSFSFKQAGCWLCLKTFSAQAEVEPVKKEYIVPVQSIGDTASYGFSTPQFLDIIKKIFAAIEKKTGIKLKYQEYECKIDKKTGQKDCFKTLMESFKEGKADFATLDPQVYIKMKESGINVQPLAAFAVDKKKTYSYCMYIRGTDKEKIKTISDSKGKTIADANCLDIGIQQILYENGIEAKMDEFFGKRISLPVASALYSLVLSEVDAVAINNAFLKFSKSQDKRFKDITPLYCTKEQYGAGGFLYRERINPEVIKKMREVLLKMHKDKDFAEVKFILIALNGYLVEMSDSDYDSYRALLKRAREKGWIK